MNNIDEAYFLTLTLRDSGVEQRVYLDGNTVRQTINIPEPEVVAAQTPAPEPMQPAGTIRPGAMQGEMSAIPQTQFERSLQTLGKSLEVAGQMVDKAAPGSINDLLEELRIKAKVPVIGDLRLRDVIPFIGGTEEVEGRTGQMTTKEVGTPQALQMAGRGESLTTGTGLTTQMKPDVKAATLDVGLTAAPLAKPAARAAKRVLDATKDLPVGLSIKDVSQVKLADNLVVDVAPAERSKNFKNWFGDSKVVDDKGQPLMLFHGTKTFFDVFKPSSRGAQGPGIYFTDSPKEAGMYTRSSTSGGENVVPVYISMKNPLRVKGDQNVFDMVGAGDDNLVDVLKKKGYDGIIWENKESPWSRKIMQEAGLEATGDTTHYVVFDPKQIKSAIGNKGTFNPNDPNILRGAAVAPAVPAAMQDKENK